VKILLLLNGSGGRTSQAELARFQARLNRIAPGSNAHITSSAEEARRMAISAPENGFDQIWIGGGDGTIHGVLGALVQCGLPLGVVPRGTVNALARSFGIPLRWDEAFDWLSKAQPAPMNLGQVNGQRHFLCFAGVGFDAAVVHAVTGRFKKVGGRFAYAIAGTRTMVKKPQPKFEIEFDDGTQRLNKQTVSQKTGEKTKSTSLDVGRIRDTGHSIMISQVPLYAGFNLFPGTSPCGQPMEVWLFRRSNPSDILRQATATVFRNRRGQPPANNAPDAESPKLSQNFGHYCTSGFVLESEFPLVLHLDGDPVRIEPPNHLVFTTVKAAIHALR
jgi:diacylglycerol kinase family enzyme